MTTTTTGLAIHDQNIEKQIDKHMGGCMSGFFNLIHRNHLLSGKRLYPKRLPPPAVDTASEPPSLAGSPALSMEFEKPKIQIVPELKSAAPPEKPATPPLPPKSQSPWKFSREAPRLSLDSRAITDAKGGLRPREIRIKTGASAVEEERESNQRRSPSVIARLMGLEPAPSSAQCSGSGSSEPDKKAELRRSASESRSRDYRFFEAPSFLSPVTTNTVERKLDHHHQHKNVINGIKNINNNINAKTKKNNNNNQRRSMGERRSYYDTADFFPAEVPAKQQQQQHQAVTIYGEIERRLRMRGIDEPSKDLETLKHILEALQLKGLLHSSAAATTGKPRQNAVYDRRFAEESPIVLMRPARPTSPTPANRRRMNVSSGEQSVSPRRERQARSPLRSPRRDENQSSSPVVRRKGGPLSVETQQTTVRGAHSPRMMGRRNDQTVNRSPRGRRSTVEICPTFGEDEVVSTVSESSFSTTSHTENERWRVAEEYRDGKNLLERCDKLLNSIAEITATNSCLDSNSNSNSNSAELQQPSPVSVLDSSFYKEDESSPSPVKKRTIDFKDHAVIELDDETWSPSSSSRVFKHDNDLDSSDDSEFSYVSEVLRASNYLPDDNNLFMLLEEQCSAKGGYRDKSKASILQRKLIFDTICEILDRNRRLPPWKTVSTSPGKPMVKRIWSEFKMIREHGPTEDLFEVIGGVLKKDLAGDSINGWGDAPVEMSEAVLDIERLIFKDLIGETIQDLATFAGENGDLQAPRRKLVF